ncbi:MAG TPA: GNAT family N-acetyltransferase [Bryobacteraceae bacterium]|nr:GNAT family N-acetyltransferase [Bryobacteraceae bacterium]
MPRYSTRAITPADLDTICHHRDAMFRDMGTREEILAPMRQGFRAWLEPKLGAGTYLGWIVEHEGAPIAGVGMFILDWPPHIWHPTDDRRAYILNMYVEPEHRGKGLAKRLMEISTGYAKSLGIRYMVLHASEAGRPIYARLGWKATSEMSLVLPEAQ